MPTHLTQSQNLVFLGQQLSPDSPLNNMAFAFRWRKQIEVAYFRQAFQRLVAASDSMRCVFTGQGNEAKMRVRETSDYQLPFIDLSNQANPENDLEIWLDESVKKVFKLEETAFDAVLLKLNDADYVLYLNQHHLITDGWGKAVQLEWLQKEYDRLLNGGATPPEAPKSFAAYVTDFATLKSPKKTAELRKKWEEKVTEYPSPPALFGRSNPDISTSSTRIIRRLSQEESDALRALCMESDIRSWTVDLSLFSIFTTVLFAYTHRISGQKELTIGSPAHNRITPADKETPGLFMELFPLHVALEDNETFGSLLTKVKVESMQFLRNAQPGTSSAATGRSFNVLLNFINKSFNENEDKSFSSTWLHPGETEAGHHFKLQVYDFDNSGQITLCFDLNDAVVESDFQALIPDQFLATLRAFATDRNQKVSQLSIEEIGALKSFNSRDESYPTGVTILDLFREQVGQRPAETAIVFEEENLTFQELDERSNQLAHALLEAGTAPEELVAICLDRSLEMMIGLFGILKAGAVYVPVDPEYPAERLRFLIEDTQATKVVCSSKTARLFAQGTAEKLYALDRDWAQIAKFPSTSPAVAIRPEQLMYVIYTSGSTGRPKGVMNQHDGLVNRLWWAQQTFQLQAEKDVVLQKTTFSFDVSVWELFWPAMVGVKLVLARPGGQKDSDYLRAVMRKEAVTTLHFVPPMLEIFLLQKAELPALRQVICSGEALKPSQVNTFKELYPRAEIHNLYGPTEAAIDVTHWPVPMGPEPIKKVPIGRPIANVPIYILDGNNNFCPVGVPGELHIGGVQVARGYHNRPELSAAKFVELELDGNTERLYKTGDLVRWLPDGNIDFLGRIDSQVKLRGFRIELGEIEAALEARNEVQQSVVLVREMGGDRQLVAYVVGSEIDSKRLQSSIAASLPAYMVPAHILVLDELPTLVNGKINRKALPLPNFTDESGGDDTLNEFEEIIHAAWTDVLGLEKIGKQTSFFDLGGHSLSGIRVMNRLNDDFELELPVNTIFKYPTIAQLADHVISVITKLMAEMEDE